MCHTKVIQNVHFVDDIEISINMIKNKIQLTMTFVLLKNLKLLTIANYSYFLMNITEQEIVSANEYEKKTQLLLVFI